MRDETGAASRGSQKWLQLAVNHRPELLHHAAIGPVEWVSPRADDEFREYRDAAFLGRIGHSGLAAALAEFWPARGPVWDALGKAGTHAVLVEAKAHLDEFFSPASQATPGSRAWIEAAFAEVPRGARRHRRRAMDRLLLPVCKQAGAPPLPATVRGQCRPVAG